MGHSHKITDDWIVRTNEDLNREGVALKQRPWLAWIRWSQFTDSSHSMDSPDARRIFEWYEQNSKPGTFHIGPVYLGSLYFDDTYWPISIPVVFGRVKVSALDSLESMPLQVQERLRRDRPKWGEFCGVWADCLDYGIGIGGLQKGKSTSTFGQSLLTAGHHQLTGAVTLLHEKNPNSKAADSARFATEIFLKAYLASKGTLDDTGARNLGHNLVKALDACSALNTATELQALRKGLALFPDVSDRYAATNKPGSLIWQCYQMAQFTGATVVRELTGRDCRPTLR